MTHINRQTVQVHHDQDNINYWTQEAVYDIIVESVLQDIIDKMYVE